MLTMFKTESVSRRSRKKFRSSYKNTNQNVHIFFAHFIAAVGSTLFLTTDFDVMTRASFLDRVITMQLDYKYRGNLVFCQSVIARKSP